MPGSALAQADAPAMARPRKYPDELRERAVRLPFESDRPIAHVAMTWAPQGGVAAVGAQRSITCPGETTWLKDLYVASNGPGLGTVPASVVDEAFQCLSVRRSPKAYFATAHEPRNANNATTIPDGMVVLCVPAPLVETKSGPHTALTDTATHITTIASDPHISRRRRSEARPRCSIDPAGRCEIVDMSTPPSCHQSLRPPRSTHPCRAGRPCRQLRTPRSPEFAAKPPPAAFENACAAPGAIPAFDRPPARWAS
jgi:hypothetical protein